MSTPIALPAINTFLKLGDQGSPENFNTIANVGDITGPGLAAAVVDVTSHSNPDPWRRKITTLLDAGQLSFKLYFIPGDTGHKQLLTVFTGRELRDYQMEFPEAVSYPTWSFSAYISKFSITATVAGVIEASCTFDIVGPPTFPAS